MKPVADKLHHNFTMGTYDATLIIRALECYSKHTENGDAADAIREAEYLKDLGNYNNEAGIMCGFYTED